MLSNGSENDEESIHRNPRVIIPGTSADFDHNSVTANSSAEINRLSFELNPRISQEMDELMNSVSVQIQRAINDATSNQVLPQTQNVIKAGSGHLTKNAWDVPSERPEVNSEVPRNSGMRNNLRSEQGKHRYNDEQPSHIAHDMVTGDNESKIVVPEFLTGLIPSRNHPNQSYDDINFDTTIRAQERTALATGSDPINRLADVLTSMHNRPTAQQLTIRPVNSNTMTFDSKRD